MRLKPPGVLLLLLLLAGAWRIAILLRTGFAIDGDEGTLGLMALHIARLQDFPVWYYGQPYMGALEAYLTAIPIAVFGTGAVVLKLSGLAFALLTVLLGWLLARRVLGPVAGLVAGLYLAVSPLVLGMWSMTMSSGYPSLLPFGIGILLCAADVGARGATPWRSAGFGLLVGLATWVNLLLFPFVGAAGLHLLSRRELVTSPRLVAWFLLGLAAGAAPLIGANITSGGETFRYFIQRSSGGPQFHLANTFVLHPLKLVGLESPGGDGSDVPAWGAIVILAFAAAAASLVWRERASLLGFLRFARSPTTGAELLVLPPLIYLAGAVVMERYGSVPSPRYAYVMYPSIAAAVGCVAAWGWERRTTTARSLTACGVSLLLAFNVTSSWLQLGPRVEDYRADSNGAMLGGANADACLALLREHGVDGLAGPHFVNYALNFLSDDQIVPSPSRFGPHAQRFRHSRQIAWAISSDDPDRRAVEPVLDALAGCGVEAEEVEAAGLRCLLLRETGCPAANWQADSNSSPTKAIRAIDRDPRTGWSAFERPLDAVEPPQLTVDLGRAGPIGRLGFAFFPLLGPPRRLGLQTSLDGEHWDPLVIYAPDAVTWSTPVVPTTARYVRLMAMEGNDMRWQLIELFVFPS